MGIASLQTKLQVRLIRRISPGRFTSAFILGDFICLCFIGCGGSLAAIYSNNPLGVDLMVAGLALQVLWTAIFCLLLGIVYAMHRAVIRESAVAHYIQRKSQRPKIKSYIHPWLTSECSSSGIRIIMSLRTILLACCRAESRIWRTAEDEGRAVHCTGQCANVHIGGSAHRDASRDLVHHARFG